LVLEEGLEEDLEEGLEDLEEDLVLVFGVALVEEEVLVEEGGLVEGLVEEEGFVEEEDLVEEDDLVEEEEVLVEEVEEVGLGGGGLLPAWSTATSSGVWSAGSFLRTTASYASVGRMTRWVFASPSVGSSLMVTVGEVEGVSVGSVVVVVFSSSAGSSMVVLGMVGGASVVMAARGGLVRTFKMEAVVALLVMVVGGLRMEVEAQKGIEVEALKILTFSSLANLTLVAMCSMAVMGMGSKRLASKSVISASFLVIFPAAFFLVIIPIFGLVGAGALVVLEVVLGMLLTLPWAGIY
jgi:hypothetical protein